MNIPQLRTDLAALHSLLRQHDMQALKVHAQLCLTHDGAQAALMALNQAMSELDFEKSMVQCAFLIDTLRPAN